MYDISTQHFKCNVMQSKCKISKCNVKLFSFIENQFKTTRSRVNHISTSYSSLQKCLNCWWCSVFLLSTEKLLSTKQSKIQKLYDN